MVAGPSCEATAPVSKLQRGQNDRPIGPNWSNNFHAYTCLFSISERNGRRSFCVNKSIYCVEKRKPVVIY